MKTSNAIIICLAVFFSIAAAPAPKANPLNHAKYFDGFSSLRSHRQGKNAEVSWSFQSLNVSGFIVQRTNEDPTDPYSVWIEVSSIPADASRTYKCHDTNCFPGLINYRIIAVMADQSTVTSDITTVRMVAH